MSKNYKTSSDASSGGIGILGCLQIIFIVLKVLKLISWSWWQVFIPTFIGLGIVALVLLGALLIIFLTYITNGKDR